MSVQRSATSARFIGRPGTKKSTSCRATFSIEKIEETVALGGDQILMQGGLHAKLPLEWYEELLSDIKTRFPHVNVHGFSPPEIHHFTKVSKKPLQVVLERLKAAGLGSLPGGGAEILVDRVRKEITRGKVLTDDWLNVNRVWHEMGGRSTATMMFGHVETLAERIEHLERLRQLQDETGGLHGFYLLDVSARPHGLVAHSTGGRIRVPQDAGGRPAVPRQHPEHPIVLGHAGRKDRSDGPVLRGQRHGQPDDRGKRRRAGRDGLSSFARDDPPLDRRGRLYSPAAKRFLPIHRRRMIHVENLTKQFSDLRRGSVTALHGVSFDVRPGEIFGLLGPNGAGKTTCLRILSTVLKPTSGTALVAGYNVLTHPADVRTDRLHVGQHGHLRPHDAPGSWSNISAGSTEWKSRVLKRRQREIFTTLQMDEFRDVLGSKMSTGMKQKVSIARTIIHNPPVLIFDEPTTGLDVLVARAVLNAIASLRDEGKCIIYSTHIMREVEKLCDRTAIIHKGRILAAGTPAELQAVMGRRTSRNCSSG